MALPHMLHCDELSLPARNGLQLALVPIGDTIRATHLGEEMIQDMSCICPPKQASDKINLSSN